MEYSFNDFGIYDLRNYARNLGIKSPTTKKKSELIKEIILIESGKNLQNPVKTSKQGRPPKTMPKQIVLNKSIINNEIEKLIYYAIKQNNETNKTLKTILTTFFK